MTQPSPSISTAEMTASDFPGGITGPKGFTASGIHCGIKRSKKDLALVYSEVPAAAAAVFTKNTVIAAPLLVDKTQLMGSPRAQAILINSGNANACTGERGLQDAWTMVHATAKELAVDPAHVLVASTGVIGQYLPMEKILAGIGDVSSSLSTENHTLAAEAIMTTDTFSKEYAVVIELGGRTVTLGGMAKGSGMIAPNMATMLGFVSTDARISPGLLQRCLSGSVNRSFNRISVDGDTSTNDMVVAFANGEAGNRALQDPHDPDVVTFSLALDRLLIRLAKMIVVDGEGATKFIEIRVRGAVTEESAVAAARAVANSNLVKTAIHGEDANWGRILSAVGNSGIEFRPEETEILFDEVPILRKNYSIDFSETAAKAVLEKKELVITIDLHMGPSAASFWTCDLSKEYVSINANYRT